MNNNTEKIPSGGPIAWMAGNHVAANLLMFLFIVGGIVFMRQATQEVFPEFTIDIVTVSVPYPGASPAEVEQGIILSIEDAVRGLDGVKEISATAAEGSGTVSIELLTGANSAKALQDIKNAVDRIQSFPEDAERPVVSLVEARKQVLSIIVAGQVEEHTLRDLAEQVRADLLAEPGITLVELGQTKPLEIAVEIPLERLRSYGLTLEAVARRIRETALELPAGTVRTAGGQILLRTQERRDTGDELRDVPVATSASGNLVRLGDIATIKDGFEELDREAQFNGKPALLVNVYRVGKQTPQEISEIAYKYIHRIEKKLPEDIELVVWDDRSESYRDRKDLLVRNARLGLILVLIILGLFLDPILAFWVTLGIPISILGAFLFIPFTGASINMISLFAFIVTLGIIVDDAVVMGENIYEKRQQGLSFQRAAIEGAREISTPIVFAILTNIAAFFPLFCIPGTSGKFFRQIPAVVVSVFIVSLIESLFVLPAHLSGEPKKNQFIELLKKPGERFRFLLDQVVHGYYPKVVRFAVANRYTTFTTSIAVFLVALGLIFGGHVSFRFLPRIDADVVMVQATLPVGVSMSESRSIEEHLIVTGRSVLDQNGGMKITKGIYSQIGSVLGRGGPSSGRGAGSGGSHIVSAQISLVRADKRKIGAVEFAKKWRKEIGTVPGIDSLVFRAETGPNEGSDIELQLSHDNRAVLEQAAIELASALSGYAGVSDIDDGFSSGKAQVSFTLTPAARSLGVTSSSLARQLRSAFYGAEALRQQRGRNEVRVRVKLPEEERNTVSTLKSLIIQTPSGGEMPLRDAANFEDGRSYTEILREEGRRVVTVSADVDEKISNANAVLRDLFEKEFAEILQRHEGLTYRFRGAQQAQQESLSAMGTGFFIAMIVVYALLAIPFHSYIQPIIVMISIPFGMIGALIGHLLLGYQLSIISMFGIIALSGVVVNDSLVLVVTANRLREKGVSAFEAIQAAGIRRFRPIVLTSLTTFLGLAPMIFETSMQARFLIPMAVSIGFGILFATVIILILTPSVYMIVEDLKNYPFGKQVGKIAIRARQLA